MSQNPLQTLLAACEEKLLESRRAVEEALAALQEAISTIAVEQDQESSGEKLRTPQQDELVKMVLAALGSGKSAPAGDYDYLATLTRDHEDNQYRIGRRQISLTDSEEQILNLLWDAAPTPVSRATILGRLYAGKVEPSSGTIDVFMSKLRQKLKFTGSGREFIQSHRGKGWSLNQDFCQDRNRPIETRATRPDRDRA